jgi:hypothetical protein
MQDDRNHIDVRSRTPYRGRVCAGAATALALLAVPLAGPAAAVAAVSHHPGSAHAAKAKKHKPKHKVTSSRGPRGPIGATGPVGPTGAVGSTGPQGPGATHLAYDATASGSQALVTLGQIGPYTVLASCVTVAANVKVTLDIAGPAATVDFVGGMSGSTLTANSVQLPASTTSNPQPLAVLDIGVPQTLANSYEFLFASGSGLHLQMLEHVAPAAGTCHAVIEGYPFA